MAIFRIREGINRYYPIGQTLRENNPTALEIGANYQIPQENSQRFFRVSPQLQSILPEFFRRGIQGLFYYKDRSNKDYLIYINPQGTWAFGIKMKQQFFLGRKEEQVKTRLEKGIAPRGQLIDATSENLERSGVLRKGNIPAHLLRE